jgi:hypothetical protein
VQRLSLVRGYLGTEALIGQEVPWYRGSNGTGGTLVGTEALIGQEVACYRGSDWAGGTLVQRL